MALLKHRIYFFFVKSQSGGIRTKDCRSNENSFGVAHCCSPNQSCSFSSAARCDLQHNLAHSMCPDFCRSAVQGPQSGTSSLLLILGRILTSCFALLSFGECPDQAMYWLNFTRLRAGRHAFPIRSPRVRVLGKWAALPRAAHTLLRRGRTTRNGNQERRGETSGP